jgi:MinD superfamily P-loop ATPase
MPQVRGHYDTGVSLIVICIASGKGGTGKTTIATNLAVALNGKVQLLDCDVEEPNATFLSGLKSNAPRF